jgi:hypothetical protein
MLPTKFHFIWPSSFRGEGFGIHSLNIYFRGKTHKTVIANPYYCFLNYIPICYGQVNQKQELHVVAMFVNESGRNEQSL